MTNRFTNLLLLIRLNSPTIYFCYFFPASFGLILAYSSDISYLIIYYLPILMVGSIITRSAGCIINDLFDRDLDIKVARTKNRPLASRVISLKEAIVLLIIILFIGLLILVYLNLTSIILGFIAVTFMIVYPLMKRFTYYPQVFLGITINLGCLIGHTMITSNISTNVLVLYLACIFWTIGYDTIYAFMDIKDDKKIGIKSTAIFFENNNYKTIILLCYIMFICLFTIATWNKISIYLTLSILSSLLIGTWIVCTLDVTQQENCLIRFKANNYIGFILFLGLLTEKCRSLIL